MCMDFIQKDGNTSSGQCPAIGTTCKFYHKKRHWIAMCSKHTREVDTLHEIESETEISDDDVLNVLWSLVHKIICEFSLILCIVSCAEQSS